MSGRRRRTRRTTNRRTRIVYIDDEPSDDDIFVEYARIVNVPPSNIQNNQVENNQAENNQAENNQAENNQVENHQVEINQAENTTAENNVEHLSGSDNEEEVAEDVVKLRHMEAPEPSPCPICFGEVNAENGFLFIDVKNGTTCNHMMDKDCLEDMINALRKVRSKGINHFLCPYCRVEFSAVVSISPGPIYLLEKYAVLGLVVVGDLGNYAGWQVQDPFPILRAEVRKRQPGGKVRRIARYSLQPIEDKTPTALSSPPADVQAGPSVSNQGRRLGRPVVNGVLEAPAAKLCDEAYALPPDQIHELSRRMRRISQQKRRAEINSQNGSTNDPIQTQDPVAGTSQPPPEDNPQPSLDDHPQQPNEDHHQQPPENRVHIGAVRRPMYPCRFCDQNFAYRSSRKTHEDKIHHKIRHPCPHCDKQFLSKSYLRLHIIKKHVSDSAVTPG